jgi:hypothetical protein
VQVKFFLALCIPIKGSVTRNYGNSKFFKFSEAEYRLFSSINAKMSVNDSPSTSNVQSSQEICAFLNRLEKDIGSLSSCSDIEDLVASELDSKEKIETAKSTSAHADRFSKKFKDFALWYFYNEVRAENGDLLSPATLSCIRAGSYDSYERQMIT